MKLKISYIILILAVLIILIVLMLYLTVFSKFKVGDLVFKREPAIKIGEIKGASFPASYLVEWQDKSLTEESLFSLKKISEMEEGEMQSILDEAKKEEEFDFYTTKGNVSISVGEEENVSNVSEISGIIPRGGFGNTPINLKNLECTPRFICGKWSECQVEYDIYTLITEQLAYGVQYRQCKDSMECMSDFIDAKRCTIREEIELRRVGTEAGGEEYIEIYDSKGKLIGRVKEEYVKNIKKLNIEFVISS